MKNANRKFLLSLLGLVVGLCGLVSTGVASKAIAAVPETRKTGAVSPQERPAAIRVANPVEECIKRENATNKANNDAINREYNSAVNAANGTQQSAAKAANDAYDSAAKAANEAQRAAKQSADAVWDAAIKAADEAFKQCMARPPPPPVSYNACQQAKLTAITGASIAHANAIAASMVGPAALLKQAGDKRDAALKNAQDALAINLKRAKDARDKALALEKNRHEAALKDCLGQ